MAGMKGIVEQNNRGEKISIIQGRSHENLSGQVILPQHSCIVSIKIVSGFLTCNSNRTVAILSKKCYHYKCTSNDEVFWKIRQ